jgi:hypothetical protein
MGSTASEGELLSRVWALLGGLESSIDAVMLEGASLLPTLGYDVNTLATASTAAATLAVAEVQSVRTGARVREVRIDRGHAGAAFRCERYVSPAGWKLPGAWDPLAGDYASKAGWIRLHTNYRHHRDAALRVLGVPGDPEAVARAVASWEGDALETAIVEAGGCAALMRSPGEWAIHPQGIAVAAEPLLALTTWRATPSDVESDGDLLAKEPLAGLRVLDLTRVIAGPVGTRTLAAFGADVLRLDPPGFEEVGALMTETTAGKRRATLDLKTQAGKAAFEGLIATAHVIVHGYRSDALARLGFARDRLTALNPGLVVVRHDAYGWNGPWAMRRGFDSLVQMSAGIAQRGMELAGASRPTPLSAQALDHATGYLIAASACRGLSRLLRQGEASETRLSLAATAACLAGLGAPAVPIADEPDVTTIDRWREDADTSFGRVRRVRYPGLIEGVAARWQRPAGALGVDEPRWS